MPARARGRSLVVASCLAVDLAVLFALEAHGHGVPETQRQAVIDGGNLSYLWLGASHMLTDYDHLLFLLGVIFFLKRLWDIVKFVTAFTLGHSISLLFATLAGIDANYFLIDAVIALSVVYIGFTNIDGFKRYAGIEPPNLLLMVFSFGLIHGFGLSTRLQQFSLPEEGLVVRILSFNLGVEVGQVAALAVMLGVIAGWRHLRSWAVFGRVVNAGLVLAGRFLCLVQIHGYLHTSYSDELGFSNDLHDHAHQQMVAKNSWIENREAVAIAEFLLEGLIAEGAVAVAWTDATAKGARPDIHQDRLVWAVAFDGASAAEAAAQRLHLYLSLDGDYLNAVEDGQS